MWKLVGDTKQIVNLRLTQIKLKLVTCFIQSFEDLVGFQ